MSSRSCGDPQMGYRPLDPEILNRLHKLTTLTEGTIRKEISILRQKYASLPINTVAQIFAVQRGFSVVQKLNKDEKAALPNLEISKPLRIEKIKKQKSKHIIEFVKYETTNRFIKDHVTETNKAYTSGCYTAAFILCRKIIENLLTDIIRRKYPSNKKQNVEIYFDTCRGRTRDFSEILRNLRKRSKDFGPDRYCSNGLSSDRTNLEMMQTTKHIRGIILSEIRENLTTPTFKISSI